MSEVVTFTYSRVIKTGTNARGPWTLRGYKAADGREFSDLGPALAPGVYDIEYETVQNGNFTNYRLKSATPVEEASRVLLPPTVGEYTVSPKTVSQEERQTIINRSASLARAIESVDAGIISWHVDEDPHKLFQIADEYVKYIEQGSEAFGQF